ncbi:MAG: CBS domain-containing protein, partial [bacterium]
MIEIINEPFFLNAKPEIIIASHAGTDFDSLASMVACKRLYPNAQVVLVAGVDENVREFLSLYEDVFKIENITDIDLSEVKTLVVTDVGQRRRLGEKICALMEQDNIKIILYDHHLTEEKDFVSNELHLENFGSATTVVLNEVLSCELSFDPMEATLYALGIYEDTGSLTFSSTTSRDLEIVAELIRKGARLDIVTRFLSHQLEPPQRQLLQKMLLNVREMHLNGRNITFTTARMNVWVKELALLTQKVSEMENADVIFSVVEMKEKLYVVGRSRLPGVNVADVLGYFGGGGHYAAASATIPSGKINRILPALIDTFRDIVPSGITAADIISSPVLTIDPDDPISSAYEKMVRNGHSGLVVVDQTDNDISGLISRKDVDKALSHELGHAPVKSIMVREVITVNEGTTLDEIQELVIERNIGRLPVMFGGKLKGIVTRSDILKAVHRQTRLETGGRMISEVERKVLLNLEKLAPVYKKYIDTAGELGHRLGYQVFLVGGIVRDLIIGRENLDIDFLVEGSGHDFAEEFGKEFDAKVDFIDRFSTAKIHVSLETTIDIAMCRCEYYRKPGALPDVAPSGLRDDLYRRDFTINALAIRLNPVGFGELIDFFRGANDLEDRRIRILHTLSFVDDPTRVFRAIRFEGRLGFRMDDETQHQATIALQDNMLEKIAPERIRNEIELILKENDPISIIIRAEEIGLLKRIHSNIKLNHTFFDPPDLIEVLRQKYFKGRDIKPWRMYLPLLFVNLNEKNLF